MTRYIMFVCVDGDPDTDPSPEPDIEKWVADNDAAGTRVGGDRLLILLAPRLRAGQAVRGEGVGEVVHRLEPFEEALHRL